MIVPPNEEALRRAAEHLRAGELVAFPTETVYGLGADATNPTAVARIFAVKDRPFFDPLIVHVDSLAMLQTLIGSIPLSVGALRSGTPGGIGKKLGERGVGETARQDSGPGRGPLPLGIRWSDWPSETPWTFSSS